VWRCVCEVGGSTIRREKCRCCLQRIRPSTSTQPSLSPRYLLTAMMLALSGLHNIFLSCHLLSLVAVDQRFQHINDNLEVFCLTRVDGDRFKLKPCQDHWSSHPVHPQLFSVLVLDVTTSKRHDLMTKYRGTFDVATQLEPVAMRDPSLLRIHIA
jgi:hypothetical protein